MHDACMSMSVYILTTAAGCAVGGGGIWGLYKDFAEQLSHAFRMTSPDCQQTSLRYILELT